MHIMELRKSVKVHLHRYHSFCLYHSLYLNFFLRISLDEIKYVSTGKNNQPTQIINFKRKLKLSTCILVFKDLTILKHILPFGGFFKAKNKILTKEQFRFLFLENKLYLGKTIDSSYLTTQYPQHSWKKKKKHGKVSYPLLPNSLQNNLFNPKRLRKLQAVCNDQF